MPAAFQITLDPFTITFLFVIAAAIVAVFVRGRKRDKCLRDFQGDPVVLVFTDAQQAAGRLVVENTGLELAYDTAKTTDTGRAEHSFILYKSEFGRIERLVRFCDALDPDARRRRHKRVKRTHHPGLLRRWGRRTINVFRTLRDSLTEVLSLLIARAQRSASVGHVLTGREKYVSQIQGQIVETVGTSYEPLLERHIGQTVTVKTPGDAGPVEYTGILKDYSADFIELLDVPCPVENIAHPNDAPDAPGSANSASADRPTRLADMIIPRTRGCVRHLAE